MRKLNIDIPIYYGSQTGTAFEFAKNLGQEVFRYGGKARVTDLATFDPATFSQDKFIVIIIATYGNGGPTNNAEKFYKWLTASDLTSNMLRSTEFAVFGCGDRMYKHFNKMAKLVAEKLTSAGAENICEVGLGDAADDIEGDFARWKKLFWKALNATTIEIKQDVTAIFDEGEFKNVNFSKVDFDLTTKQYIESSNVLRE